MNKRRGVIIKNFKSNSYVFLLAFFFMILSLIFTADVYATSWVDFSKNISPVFGKTTIFTTTNLIFFVVMMIIGLVIGFMIQYRKNKK
ncbi:MAG TPA: hypothetical protein VFC73_08930 [Syntrophomonadaceae bacterium]|nr:hypothetical protein [Syntrophomonadaceae bacterium]